MTSDSARYRHFRVFTALAFCGMLVFGCSVDRNVLESVPNSDQAAGLPNEAFRPLPLQSTSAANTPATKPAVVQELISAVAFGDHGTNFNVPAEIKLDLEGLDLSGYGEDEIDLYGFDRDTDTWFLVPRNYKVIELDQGKIQGIWYFDHFSRYSLGGGDIDR